MTAAMTPNVAAARTAVRSIRDDRVTPIELEVRRSETVRDDVEEPLTAETAVVDPHTGRFLELTARQMTAIHLLTMGKSVVATAKSLEIGVSTLHRWKSKHPAFIAELNRRKHEVFERTVDKLRATMSKAVEELWNLMNSRNPRERYEIAMKLLPLMGPRKWIEPTGPSDAEMVVEEQVREKRRQRGEEMEAEITEAEKDAAIAEAELPAKPAQAGHPEERSDEGPPGRKCLRSRNSAAEILRRCAPLDDYGGATLEDQVPGNVRTHADGAGMRPGESTDSGGRSVTA